MLRITLILLFFAYLPFVFSQEIVYKPVFGGYHFYQNDKILTETELKNAMQTNALSANYYRRAKANKNISKILSSFGGLIVGYQLGSYLYGSAPNWELTAVGSGLILFSLPFNVRHSSLKTQAVRMYNDSIYESSFHQSKPKLYFSSNTNGVGFLLTF